MPRNLTFSLAFVSMLLLGKASQARNSQPTPVYTFDCTGNPAVRTGNCPNGGRAGFLLLGSEGNFYGTAQVSSEGSSQPDGGTVYSLTPAGKFTLLHKFLPGPNKNYPNGDNPGLLVEGPDGNLYGTTLFGGTKGFGVLYRVNKTGTVFKIIHQFCSAANCTDGEGAGRMVVNADGNIYGTTYYGGTGSCYQSGCGTIFRVTPSTGAYEVVFSFNGASQGGFPSGLLQASDGSLYGLAGVLFHFIPSNGDFEAVQLHFPSFNNLPSVPITGLTLGPNGIFYGLYTIYAQGGAGLFTMQLDGSNLQLFPEYNTLPSGGSPEAMLLASDGNFWVSNYDGNSGYGNILAISASQGTVLRTLSPLGAASPVGAYLAGLVQSKDGKLWGSTYSYGTAPQGQFGDGVVFSVNAGLPPQ